MTETKFTPDQLGSPAKELYEALESVMVTAAQLGATDMEIDIGVQALAKARGEI